MKIIDYYDCEDQEYWLNKIHESDWGAGQYLYELLKDNKLRALVGEVKVLLLTEEKELVSFCTYADKDEIQPTELTPWIGFVYTFPKYRGHHYVGELLKYCNELAKLEKIENIYISTNHIGLYEKYGYEFLQIMKDTDNIDSRIYTKKVG